MTRARRPRKQRPTPDALAFYDPGKVTPDEAVLVAARAQGCTCQPTVTIRGASVLVQHDDWCVLLRRKDVN